MIKVANCLEGMIISTEYYARPKQTTVNLTNYLMFSIDASKSIQKIEADTKKQ